MQQKTLKYGLIAGVIFIWGMIIYKIIAAQEKDVITGTVPYTSVKLVMNDIDSFSLNTDYPDPFLPDTIRDAGDTVQRQVIQTNVTPVADMPKPDLSHITYNGMIANTKKKTRIGIVQVSGKDILVKENEEYGNIVFKKITRDWIKVVLQQKEYKIFKNQ